MSDTTPELSARRPLRSRDVRFFQNLAAALVRWKVSPNSISGASAVFGCCAGLCFALTRGSEGFAERILWLAAAGFIQLRLMANLLDGMVAVEGRRGGPTGDLWNEAPDRISDVATLVGAGYALGGSPLLGWSAAAAALFVAYVRALGASAGTGQVFTGPMAKPQRMFWLTVVSLFFALMPYPLDAPNGIAARILALCVLAGAFVDLKNRLSSRTRQGWLALVLAFIAGYVLYDWFEGKWVFPLMPLTLLAITIGGVFTSILRLREIASILRRLKGEGAVAVS